MYNAYDPDMGISFEGFLRSCLEKKFKSELTRRHRDKRLADRFAVSLDAVGDDGEEHSLMDCIASDFDTFEETVRESDGGQYHDKGKPKGKKPPPCRRQVVRCHRKFYKDPEDRDII